MCVCDERRLLTGIGWEMLKPKRNKMHGSILTGKLWDINPKRSQRAPMCGCPLCPHMSIRLFQNGKPSGQPVRHQGQYWSQTIPRSLVAEVIAVERFRVRPGEYTRWLAWGT